MKRRHCALLLVLALVGCKSASNPTTPVAEKSIVQKVEDGGISEAELNQADAAGLQLWFAKHPSVAQSVAAQCKAAMKSDMAWKTSIEGRICLGDKFDNYGQ